jgi:hypothetical protein
MILRAKEKKKQVKLTSLPNARRREARSVPLPAVWPAKQEGGQYVVEKRAPFATSRLSYTQESRDRDISLTAHGPARLMTPSSSWTRISCLPVPA